MSQRVRVVLIPALWLGLTGLTYSAASPSKVSGFLSDFHQQVWNNESGLPQNNVLSLAQDTDGYLWAGTELGLSRFDGYQFSIFDKGNTPQFKSNKINALLPDRDSGIWIATQSGELTRFRKGKFRTFTPEYALSQGAIHCLLQDATGDIWIGTEGAGLSRFHAGKFSVFPAGEGLRDLHIQALAQDRDGTIWIGTHNGLSSYRAGVFRSFNTADGLPDNYIRSLLATPQGVLWIGTNGGLSQLVNGRFLNTYMKDGLSSNAISSLALDNSGALWIGTLSGSIDRLSAGQISADAGHRGMPGKEVWCILRDRTGSIWIGTGGGLVKLESQSVLSTLGTAEGLAGNVALPIYQDHQGSVWIGTNGSGLSRLRDGVFTTFTTQDGLLANTVFSLTEDQTGRLWIGTRNGISTYRHGTFETVAGKNELPATPVALYTASNGAVWIGTRAGLVRWQDNSFTTFTVNDGLSSDVIRTIYEDHHHQIWIGTGGGGLNLYVNNRFQVFNTRKGLSNDVVMAIYEGANGALWVGTDGGGLNRYKDGRFAALTSKDGLLDDSIFRILSDGSHALWMSSNKGLAHVQEAALNDFADGRLSHIPVLSYGTSDGMPSRECNGGFQPAGWSTADGKLWFPTMKGVVVVDPSKVVTNGPQQATIIEKIVINQQIIPPGAAVELPVGGGNLEVDYTAINFRAPSRIRFEYRLLGFETDWVPAQQRRIATYTNLPPGHYRFEVRATNEDNSWSTAKAFFPVILQPHFYQTFLFYFICSLGLVLVAGFAHRAYVRQLRERERTLEQHVHQRTAELRSEIAERELAQRESIRAREAAEQASRVKSEFLANMSHEIRTPMNGILGMTRLTLAATPDAKQKQFLEIIRDSADALLVVIDDILDFSKVEAGKLELNPLDFNIRQVAETVVKSLAFRAEQKELGLSFHVDSGVPDIVHSDPMRLRQVLLNLLGNALKFTDRGEVHLGVLCDGCTDSQTVLRFVVTDTGIGIPTENLTSIFDAFSQADSSTTRKYGGTGLGLAICHRLVELMGGRIWATSELGSGSQFHFTVRAGVPTGIRSNAPVAQNADSHFHALASLSGRLQSSVRVLVAEDNPANRMVAKFTLEQAGFQVYDVENGSEALAAVQQGRFDLILMDCRMPVMDGYVATEKIRQLKGPAGLTPILALTASAFQEDRDRAQRSGMNDFIAKPFSDQELIQKCLFWLRDSSVVADLPPEGLEHLATAITTVDSAAIQSPATPAKSGFSERYSRHSPEFLRDMLEVFLQTAPPVFGRLRESIRNQEWEQAREAAHWLRGGGTRMTGPEMQQRFAELEDMLRSESPVVSEPDLILLTHLFNETCAEAKGWLSAYRVPVAID